MSFLWKISSNENSSYTHFRSEKYEKIKNVQVNHPVVADTRNVDAVFYKFLDNTNIYFHSKLYYNAKIEYEKSLKLCSQCTSICSLLYRINCKHNFFYILKKNKLCNSKLYNYIVFVNGFMFYKKYLLVTVCQAIPLYWSILTLDWMKE